jgi:hypothetical protein
MLLMSTSVNAFAVRGRKYGLKTRVVGKELYARRGWDNRVEVTDNFRSSREAGTAVCALVAFCVKLSPLIWSLSGLAPGLKAGRR